MSNASSARSGESVWTTLWLASAQREVDIAQPGAADRERTLFREAMARLPADHKFLSNFAHTTLGVAEAMLDGEVEYHRGNYE